MARPTNLAATTAAPSPSIYTTTRLDVAALLLCYDAPLAHTSFDGHHVQFAFADGDGRASDLADRHDRGVLTVTSRRYSAALDQARDLVFASRRSLGLAR